MFLGGQKDKKVDESIVDFSPGIKFLDIREDVGYGLAPRVCVCVCVWVWVCVGVWVWLCVCVFIATTMYLYPFYTHTLNPNS